MLRCPVCGTAATSRGWLPDPCTSHDEHVSDSRRTMVTMTHRETPDSPTAVTSVVTSTQSGDWPRMMVDLAARLEAAGHTMACSPDPSTRPNQAVVMVEFADGTLARTVCDPTGASPVNDRGLCNYDHHGDEHREKMLDALIADLQRLGGATLPGVLNGYKEFWQGHHQPAAALTLWWDARMAEGHTVDNALFLLRMIACPALLSRVNLSEHQGRTRAWLNYRATPMTAETLAELQGTP